MKPYLNWHFSYYVSGEECVSCGTTAEFFFPIVFLLCIVLVGGERGAISFYYDMILLISLFLCVFFWWQWVEIFYIVLVAEREGGGGGGLFEEQISNGFIFYYFFLFSSSQQVAIIYKMSLKPAKSDKWGSLRVAFNFLRELAVYWLLFCFLGRVFFYLLLFNYICFMDLSICNRSLSPTIPFTRLQKWHRSIRNSNWTGRNP